jgi:hypothetical protein
MTKRQRPYTLADLAEAEAGYASAQARVDIFDSNNPNRGQSDLRRAGDHLTRVTLYLQAQGDLPKPEPTRQDNLEQALDAAFPQARSKDMVEYEGKRYQLRFAPARMTRLRKRVAKWERWWQAV